MNNCEAVGARYVNSLLTDAPFTEEERQAIIHFYAYVFFGAVTRWLESDMTYDVLEDFRRLYQLIIEPAMKQLGLRVELLR